MHIREWLKVMKRRLAELEREARQKSAMYGPDAQPLDRPEAEWGRLTLDFLHNRLVKREE